MALLLATVAGPTAEIIGIDLDEGAIEFARRRASERKLQRVSFHLSNLHLYQSDAQFDAIIGRNILIHQSDPVSALKSLTRHLRSGGIVAFQELWLSRVVCYPMIPLLNKLVSWIVGTFKAAGLDPDLGAHLPRFFTSAGLASPELCFESLLDCRANTDIVALGVDTVRSLLPTMERLGIASREEVQLDTLADRLHSQARERGSLFGLMPMVGAWSRKV